MFQIIPLTKRFYASKSLYHILDKHIPLITLDEDVLEEIGNLYEDIESIIQNDEFTSIFVLFLCKHSIASHLNIHRFLWTLFCLKDVRRRKMRRLQPFREYPKFYSLNVQYSDIKNQNNIIIR